MLLRNFRDPLFVEQRTSGTTQGAVGRNMYPLLFAKVNNILLWEVRMVFNLVYGWYYRDVWEELAQISDAVVGDTNGFDFAGFEEVFHLFVGLDV